MNHTEHPKTDWFGKEAFAWLAHEPIPGMICILIATGCFATMQMFIRVAALEIPAVEVAFFRSAFGLILQLPVLWWMGVSSIRTNRLGLHGVRGFVHAISMMLWFVALMKVPLAEATALEFASPIMATALAILFLGEVARTRRLVALGAGVFGVLIIVRPGFEAVTEGQLLCLASIALWAGCQLMIRELGKTETAFTQGFYMVMFFTPITLVASVPVWVWPGWETLGILVITASVATAGTWFYGEAFRRAEMSAILPLESTKLLWSVGYGWLLFSEVPEVITLFGGAIIFASAAYITLREARLARLKRV